MHALHTTRSSHDKASCLSIGQSVRLSNAWIVTKKVMPKFLRHMKERLS